MKDLIIKQNKLDEINPFTPFINGYDLVSKYFAEFMNGKTFIDRFYVAIFEARRNNMMPYESFHELFELDQDYRIIWQIDWCEGENDIINLRFYSFKDIIDMALDYEFEYIPSCTWFNRKRV